MWGIRSVVLQRLRGTKPQVVLLSKPDCGLCDEAERVVYRVFGRGNVRVVNIVGESDLEALYVFRIPVLMAGETIIAEGRIEEPDARLALKRAQGLLKAEANPA